MRKRTWKIIDYGKVPKGSPTVEYDCQWCGRGAEMPVLGLPLAQLAGGGIVFDIGPHAIPAVVQCRHCLHIFEVEA